MKNTLKEKSTNLINITKKTINKTFSFTKIKSNILKDKINFKIRKKAIIATKARLAQIHKTFDNFSDEELEIIIADEERKIIDNLKTKSFIAVLAVLGLDFLV